MFVYWEIDNEFRLYMSAIDVAEATPLAERHSSHE